MIQFTAAVYKVQTLVDGGLRLTLDLPETAITQAAQLMECQRVGQALTITAETQQDDGRIARNRRKSQF